MVEPHREKADLSYGRSKPRDYRLCRRHRLLGPIQSNHPRQNVNEGDISEILLTYHRRWSRHTILCRTRIALSFRRIWFLPRWEPAFLEWFRAERYIDLHSDTTVCTLYMYSIQRQYDSS